tara:strand:- start:2342 stop:3274 length:933 start_codon:yes stop_codon:yes gene_type:complete
MATRWAIIDLGTNTFHLLIIEKQGDKFQKLFHESLPARIGKGGIGNNLITEEAIERALTVLTYFREQLDKYEIASENINAFGTSAIRNAHNQTEFCEIIRNATQIPITVISGQEEATLIYLGVKDGTKLGTEPSLIMDIGGGSVEFIIGNENQIFWKQSFEVGGQRLMEKFMKKDPITEASKRKLYSYLDENLIELANAMHQYAPKKLVGSSGTFETLIDIEFHNQTGNWPPFDQTDFALPIDSFYAIFSQLLVGNQEQRMAIPGMISLRVDMIVVASCLIDYILKTFQITHIQVSRYALKEGVLAKLLK